MKKMRSLVILALGMLLFVSCSNNVDEQKTASAETPKTEKADTNTAAAVTKAGKANIMWEGTKVVGDAHTGTLTAKEAELAFTNGVLSGGKVTVDMTSLNNTDLEGEWKQKLEGHLASEDFFATEKYPTSVVELTAVEAGSEPNTLNAKANLTIKETTLEQTFVIKIAQKDNATVYKTKLDVDRTKYGIKYGSNNFFDDLKDKAINDIISLEVEIVVDGEKNS